jgi:hypothetical protein
MTRIIGEESEDPFTNNELFQAFVPPIISGAGAPTKSRTSSVRVGSALEKSSIISLEEFKSTAYDRGLSIFLFRKQDCLNTSQILPQLRSLSSIS